MKKNVKYHIARPGKVWQHIKDGKVFGRRLGIKGEDKIENYREVRRSEKTKDTPPETEGKQESDINQPQDQDPAKAQAAGADTGGKTSGRAKPAEGKPARVESGNPNNENNGGA